MENYTLFALIFFLITYILIFTLQKLRPYVAVASALIFVIVGSVGIFEGFSYSPLEALGQIDWNVIMMIAGSMGTVGFFIESKMPNLLSDIIISKVYSARWLIVVLSLFAGLVSAFVDNTATVLMTAPVALAICKKIDISPVPVIICIAISSNLQGAATLVGDTTSILLAKAADLDFMSFFFVEGKPGMFWVTEAGAVASAAIILLMFRKENKVFSISDRTEVKDKFPAVMLCLTILTLIATSFIPYSHNAQPGQWYKPDITNGLICIFYFAVCLLHRTVKDKNISALKKAFKEIDYYTIVLLAGLFVVIGGISEAGIIDMLGRLLAGLGGDGSRMSIFIVYSVIVWASVAISAFIDNIPYTATMLPVVAVLSQQLSAAGGLEVNPNLFYFGLLAGATLGGNITPIGASANVAGTGILRREGYEVSAKEFMSKSVPFTLTAVTVAYVLLWIIWM